jgi:type I restriction enzyme M protein
MDTVVHCQIVNFIWGIADDCLRDVYVRRKHRNVILPMTVICRLEEITADIKALEAKTKGLLEKTLGD